MTKQQSSRLGRGLGSLLGEEVREIRTNGSSTISEIPLSQIVANPNQPRRNFNEEELNVLAESIRSIGVITPVTLRKNEDNTYLIIAGERRYRASKIAGLTTIPAYVRTVDDEQLMEMALIENIQRTDLDAIEIALGYQRLIEEYSLTHEQVSQKVGMSRTNVSNYLRLLNLPAEIQMGLQAHSLEMGHARALLSVSDTEWQLDTYHKILANGLSVRQVEALARQYGNPKSDEPVQPADNETDTEIFGKLKELFGDRVKYKCNKRGKGQITISFDNHNQLSELLNQLGIQE